MRKETTLPGTVDVDKEKISENLQKAKSALWEAFTITKGHGGKWLDRDILKILTSVNDVMSDLESR